MIKDIISLIAQLLETGIVVWLWYKVDILTKQVEDLK